MSDIKKKIGYVILDFFEKDNQKMKNYFNKFINEKDYSYTEVNEKEKGGLVLDKMHITLFYGLDHKKFNDEMLGKIKINDIELGKLTLFYIKEFQCNALVLKINNSDKKLEKIHNFLSKLDIIKEKKNKFKFTPHITIAYVSKNFKIKDKNYFLNKKLKIKSIEYKIKS